MQVAMVDTGLLGAYEELVVTLGGSPLDLLQQAGIKPSLFRRHPSWLEYAAIVDLLERTAATLGSPDFGLIATLQCSRELWRPLRGIVRRCTTLREALEILCDQARNEAPRTSLVPADERQALLRLDVLPGMNVKRRQAVEQAVLRARQCLIGLTQGCSHPTVCCYRIKR